MILKNGGRSIKNLIIIRVLIIFIGFSLITFFTFNQFYLSAINNKFTQQNRLNLEVTMDLFHDTLDSILDENIAISNDYEVLSAFIHGLWLPEPYWYRLDNYKIISKDIYLKNGKPNRVRWLKLLQRQKNKYYNVVRDKIHYTRHIQFFDENFKPLIKTSVEDKRYKLIEDTGKEPYINYKSKIGTLYFKGLGFSFFQREKDYFFFKTSYHVRDSYGRIIISSMLDNEYLEKEIKKVISSEIIIIDKSGKVLLSTLRDIRGKNFELMDSDSTKNENHDIKSDGADYSFSFKELKGFRGENLDAYVGVGFDKSIIGDLYFESVKQFGTIVLITFVIVLGLMYASISNDFKPFYLVINAISCIGEGKKVKLEEEYTNEINDLIKTVNKLSGDIEERERGISEILSLESEKYKNREDLIAEILKNLVEESEATKALYFDYDYEKEEFTMSGSYFLEELVVEKLKLSIYKEKGLRDAVFKGDNDKYRFNSESEIEYLFNEGYDVINIKDKKMSGIVILDLKKSLEEQNYMFNIMLKALKIYINKSELSRENIQANKFSRAFQLLRSIVHELKNPLSGIRGFTSMASSKINKLDDSIEDKELILSYLNVVKDESLKLNNLTNEVLTFSCSDQLEFYTVNFREFLFSVVEKMKDLLNYENAKVKINLDEDIRVKINFEFFEKVLTNLIKNSIEAKDEDREIEIGIDVVVGERIELRIRDNGVGIPEKRLEDIFELQVTTKIQGSGLGLPVVKDIVEKHGGKISVESEEGVYTEFLISLPKYLLLEG